MYDEEKDGFYELYSKAKLTVMEIKEFPEFKDYSDLELAAIADNIYDLAVLAQKIII
jgi:hypothetical protein